MFNWIRRVVLDCMRLPPEPQPPAGDPASVRVFRAGKNFYWFCLARWAGAQLATLAGIIFSLNLLWSFERAVESHLSDASRASAVEPSGGMEHRNDPEWIGTLAPMVAPHAAWIFPLVTFVEVAGLLIYLAQMIGTGMLVRLEYELRWYIVTDRSLRIRSGIWRVHEATMSFANLQQVELSEGPVQRLLGIADVRVTSAGGGGGGAGKENQSREDSLHTGRFHGVTDAGEIRDLILNRLREFRESGLGDPDDASPGGRLDGAEPAEDVRSTEALLAAGELLAEARALRETVENRRGTIPSS
ncbi:MAG: PH domain-containing protein [Opitutaceae bacterium]